MNVTYSLTFSTVMAPVLDGPIAVYVSAGDLFDADDYAHVHRINRSDIDAQAIHSAQDAAGRLNPGEWLAVTHEASSPAL